MHDIWLFSTNCSAQSENGTEVRCRRVERMGGVRVKTSQILAPSLYTNDPHPIDYLFLGEPTGLNRDNNGTMSETE